MRTRTKTAIVLSFALILGTVALSAAADPRCEEDRFKDRPICQTHEPDPTTTTTVPETTTTTSQFPSTTTGDSGSLDAIAGVGCSNTKDAIEGYLDQSSADILIPVAAGGHTIETWAENTQSSRKDPWGRYLDFRPADGYDGAWLQLCERASAGLTVENVVTILEDLIWANDPGIPVWISPMNFYEDETCDVTNGNQIPNEGAVIADDLSASMGNVHRGPDLGVLTDAMLRRDDCHPNSSGVNLLGSQLVGFFD